MMSNICRTPGKSCSAFTVGNEAVMTTILPEGDAIRNAVKWITATLQEESPPPLRKLIEEATLRFDLSPLEAEFLTRFYDKGIPPG
jgi:hypothetical protein